MIDYYLTQSKVLKQSGFTWKTDWELHKGDEWVLPPISRNAQKLFLFSARGQHDQSNHKQHRGKWGKFHDTIPRFQSKQLCPYLMAHRSILPSICNKQIRLLLNQVIYIAYDPNSFHVICGSMRPFHHTERKGSKIIFENNWTAPSQNQVRERNGWQPK